MRVKDYAPKIEFDLENGSTLTWSIGERLTCTYKSGDDLFELSGIIIGFDFSSDSMMIRYVKDNGKTSFVYADEIVSIQY